MLSGRTEETLASAAEALGDRASYVVADNAERDAPASLIGEAHDRWGRVDGALVSVGGPPTGRVSAVTDEQWTTSFETVFLGAVRMAREISAALEDGGALALVLSSSVHSPLTDMAISNGLRPGLAMLTKQLADELGPRGVRVNGLLPGRIGTERVAELDALKGDPQAAKAASLRTIPLGRYGEPVERSAVPRRSCSAPPRPS